MRPICPYLAFIGILSMNSVAVLPQQLRHRPPERNPTIVVCRVMEAHASREPDATIVVFHQRDKADAERLGALLRRSSGKTVEFQADEGSAWQRASVARLKSCFGRGLLVLPSGAAQIKEGDEFLLKFTSD